MSASESPISASGGAPGVVAANDPEATLSRQTLSGTAADSDADPRHPVVAWCEDHDVDIRQARIYLRKSFPVWFTDLRDWRDLAELDAERVPRALAYLSAQFDQPKDGEG
jgi:hypothetical protein